MIYIFYEIKYMADNSLNLKNIGSKIEMKSFQVWKSNIFVWNLDQMILFKVKYSMLSVKT